MENENKTWKDLISDKKFKIEFFITTLLLILTLYILANFLNYVELRKGFVLDDPVLNLVGPHDLTWFTFILIYASLFISVGFLFKDPRRLLQAFQAYILMIGLRILLMSLVPLDPPEGMIPLTDPFVEYFGTGKLLTKDLFFSGHTATIFLLFLTAKEKYLKIFLLVCTILVGIFVLIQHVHYTIDVIAAPVFTWLSYRLTQWIRSITGLAAVPHLT